MASCPRCGKPRVRKNKLGFRSCRHCGALPGPKRLNRSGDIAMRKRQHIIEAIERQIAALQAIKEAVPGIDLATLNRQATTAELLVQDVIRPMQEANSKALIGVLGLACELGNADFAQSDNDFLTMPDALSDLLTDIADGVAELRGEGYVDPNAEHRFDSVHYGVGRSR